MKWLIDRLFGKPATTQKNSDCVRMRTLTGLANFVLRHDGLAAKMDLQTTEGDIEVEMPVASFAFVISNIANLATEAWRQQNKPNDTRSQAGNTVEIKATSIQLIQAPDGAPHFLFRVGALDFVFPFDLQKLAQDSVSLMAALQAAAATDRARRGSR